MERVRILGIRGLIARRFAAVACTVLIWIIPGSVLPQDNPWQVLETGLELGKFKVLVEAPAGDSTIVIARIDPAQWELRLHAISATNEQTGRTARQWCDKYGLVAAINAGMFMTDYRTHVGYMKSGDHINCASVTKYESAAAFDPLRPDLPEVRLFDLDEIPLDSILELHGNVVQNLRLIKRPRENRWSQQPRKWSEAALGEDREGRILFIFCQSPYSMYDFNHLLMSLPIDLVCAQHLEGGPEAQLYIRVGEQEWEFSGSYETGFMEGKGNVIAWPIPNILGVVRKTQ
jgi:uncharacterized protein YigE (DUF2233 family)